MQYDGTSVNCKRCKLPLLYIYALSLNRLCMCTVVILIYYSSLILITPTLSRTQ